MAEQDIVSPGWRRHGRFVMVADKTASARVQIPPDGIAGVGSFPLSFFYHFSRTLLYASENHSRPLPPI